MVYMLNMKLQVLFSYQKRICLSDGDYTYDSLQESDGNICIIRLQELIVNGELTTSPRMTQKCAQ